MHWFDARTPWFPGVPLLSIVALVDALLRRYDKESADIADMNLRLQPYCGLRTSGLAIGAADAVLQKTV
jgi:hypothetical protein